MAPVSPTVAANAPLHIAGWAVDSTQSRLAGGVAVVVDQKSFPAVYGQSRPDVAEFFKNPALLSCGFSAEIPGDAVGKGHHQVVIQVIAPSRKVYWVGAGIGFNAN